MWTLLSIAWRNVLRHRRRTLLTLSAVVLGVGVATLVRGVLNGLQAAMLDSVVEGGVGALQVHHAGYLKNVLSTPLALDLPADDAFLQKLERISGVRAVAPRIAFAGQLSLGDLPLPSMALGLDPVRDARVCPQRSSSFVDGAALDRPTAMLLGEAFTADLEGMKPDAEAALLAGDRDGLLNGEAVTVRGRLRAGMGGEQRLLLVPLPLAQRLLRMEGRATELAVAVDSLDALPQVQRDLLAALGPGFEVNTWSEVAPYIKDGIARQSKVAGLVVAIFFVLMLLGVANTMLMSVMERTREIGTMLAVGVRRWQIRVLFLMEAGLLGALGGAAGVALGTAACAALAHRGMNFMPPGSSVPFLVRPFVTLPLVGFSVALASLGACLFALYPAWRASRLRPVQALSGA
jgi:putative ABC transport system permease protein